MEEENPQVVCMECADKLLAEYEKRIRADLIDDIIEEMDILNHQGGGLDDLLFYLTNLKEQI